MMVKCVVLLEKQSTRQTVEHCPRQIHRFGFYRSRQLGQLLGRIMKRLGKNYLPQSEGVNLDGGTCQYRDNGGVVSVCLYIIYLYSTVQPSVLFPLKELDAVASFFSWSGQDPRTSRKQKSKGRSEGQLRLPQCNLWHPAVRLNLWAFCHCCPPDRNPEETPARLHREHLFCKSSYLQAQTAL